MLLATTGGGTATLLYETLSSPAVRPLSFALFLGTALSITAFPVLARILSAVALAWGLLTEFCGMSWQAGDFLGDLQREMNDHIGQTSADRHPWVWIMERFAGELAAGRYNGPYCFDTVPTDEGGEEAVICLRTSDVMHHMQTTSALRDFWNSLPVKSDRVFKKQMEHAGVIVGEVERTIGNTMVRRRYSRLAAVSLAKLEGFGVLLHRQVESEG